MERFRYVLIRTAEPVKEEEKNEISKSTWLGMAGGARGEEGLRNAITRGQVRRREKGMCERSRRRSWWLRALTHTHMDVCVCDLGVGRC